MVPRERVKWRDTPRHTLRDGQTGKLAMLFAIFWGTAWLLAGQYLVAAVLGPRAPSGGSSRIGDAMFGLAALTVAAGATWFAVRYLRRPLLPEDERPPADLHTPDDVRRRSDAEETARRYR